MFLKMVWVLMFFCLIFPFKSIFFMQNRMSILKLSLLIFIKNIFKEIDKSNSFLGFSLIFLSLFFFIFVINFFSLTGYIFSCSSHISLNLSMGVVIWVTSIFMVLVKSPLKFLDHFVPKNTPIYLISLLILVEILSNLIRPLVLSVRLTANLFAGHMLMCLISLMKISMFSAILFFSVNFLFLLLEMMVSLIQAYIFSLLSMIYFSEIIN